MTAIFYLNELVSIKLFGLMFYWVFLFIIIMGQTKSQFDITGDEDDSIILVLQLMNKISIDILKIISVERREVLLISPPNSSLIFLLANCLISPSSKLIFCSAECFISNINQSYIKNYQFHPDIMSRSKVTAAQSTAKAPTPSGKTTKPVPTSWKERLAPEDYEELVETFRVFDEDNSGTIDAAQINKVMEELGLDRRSPYVLNLIGALKDKNKPINLEQFIDIVASKVGEVKTKDGIKRIFALIDKDENGIIDFEEFKTISKHLKENLNDDDLLELLHSTHITFKTSSNEGFTFEEFYSVVSKFNNK